MTMTSTRESVTSSSAMTQEWSAPTTDLRMTSTPASLLSIEEDFFQGVHTTLTILALSSNCLSLLVIYGIVSQLTPPLRWLTSLSFAQMLSPWAVMTIYFSRSACQEEIQTSVLLTSHNAAALTLLSLSFCHHTATFHPFQYTKLLSPRKNWIGIVVVWVASLLLGHVHFLASLRDDHSNDTFCDRICSHTGIALWVSSALTTLVFASGMVIYWRILVSLRPVEAFVAQGHCNKSTRGVHTGIALLAGHVVAWVPYLVVRSVATYLGVDSKVTLLTTAVCQAVILANCFLDPLLYGWRSDTVKTGYCTLGRRIRTRTADVWRRFQRRVWCREEDEIPTTPLNQIDSICY